MPLKWTPYFILITYLYILHNITRGIFSMITNACAFSIYILRLCLHTNLYYYLIKNKSIYLLDNFNICIKLFTKLTNIYFPFKLFSKVLIDISAVYILIISTIITFSSSNPMKPNIAGIYLKSKKKKSINKLLYFTIQCYLLIKKNKYN